MLAIKLRYLSKKGEAIVRIMRADKDMPRKFSGQYKPLLKNALFDLRRQLDAGGTIHLASPFLILSLLIIVLIVLFIAHQSTANNKNRQSMLLMFQ